MRTIKENAIILLFLIFRYQLTIPYVDPLNGKQEIKLKFQEKLNNFQRNIFCMQSENGIRKLRWLAVGF